MDLIENLEVDLIIFYKLKIRKK